MFWSHFACWNGVTVSVSPPGFPSVGAAQLWSSWLPCSCDFYTDRRLLVRTNHKRWKHSKPFRTNSVLWLKGPCRDQIISVYCPLHHPFECQSPLARLLSQEEHWSLLLAWILPSAEARQPWKSPGRRSSYCFDEGTYWVFSTAMAKMP